MGCPGRMEELRPTILLTRPRAQATRFADAFAARFGPDWRVLISPLIEVRPVALAQDPARFAGLIFTSQNGVAAFAAQVTGRDWPVWCVGPQTTEAARAAGFRARDAGGNATDLAAKVRGAGPWLWLHGQHVKADLAETLTLAGTDTIGAMIYRQDEAGLDPEAARVLRSDQPVIVPLFSPRSAGLFQSAARRAVAPLWIAALSKPVAAALTLPLARLTIADQPNGNAMLDAIGRLIRAERLEGGATAR